MAKGTVLKRLKDIKVLPQITLSGVRMPLPKDWLATPLEITFLLFLILASLLLIWPILKSSLPSNPFSAPTIPFLAGILGKILGLPFEKAVVIVLTSFSLCGYISFYLLIKEIAQRRLTAVLATVFYATAFQKELPSNLAFALILQDGAHVASLASIPLAILVVRRFMRGGSFSNVLKGSLLTALVALISPFGLLSLIIFLVIFAFSEMLLGEVRLKLTRLLLCLFLALGFSLFWYNPGFLLSMFKGPEGRALVSTLWNLIPPSFFVIPILGTFGFLLFERRPFLQSTFIALSATSVFFLLSWSREVINLPAILHPTRYLIELKLATSLLSSIGAIVIFDFLGKLTKVGNLKLTKIWSQRLGLGFLVILFLGIAIFWLRSFRGVYGGQVEPAKVTGISVQPQVLTTWKGREKTGPIAEGIGFAGTGLTIVFVLFTRKALAGKE